MEYNDDNANDAPPDDQLPQEKADAAEKHAEVKQHAPSEAVTAAPSPVEAASSPPAATIIAPPSRTGQVSPSDAASNPFETPDVPQQRTVKQSLSSPGSAQVGYAHTATTRTRSGGYDRVSGDDAPMGGVTLERLHVSALAKPEPTQRWAVGPTRKNLRDLFNSKEVEAAKLIDKYDANKNKVLDTTELRPLLTDYASAKVKDADIRYIMMIADANRDDNISQEEVLFALSAWFAFNEMGQSVGAAFKKHKVGYDRPLPPVQDMHDFLETLNDQQPVTMEEATYVREVALALGATESKSTYEQMRRAVAAWYLNIERGSTSKTQLGVQALHDAKDKLQTDYTFMKGDFHLRNPDTQRLIVVLVIVFLLFPICNMKLSDWFPTGYTCEHPHLSILLWWMGLVMLLLGVTIAFAMGAHSWSFLSEVPYIVLGSRCAVGMMTVIAIMLELFGASHVMSCSAQRCGFVIWSVSQFTFFVVPSTVGILVCCGLPFLVAKEHYNNLAVDRSITEGGNAVE